MLENPPPDGKRVTATSSSFLGSPPVGRKVAPAAVMYGQDAGKSGLKTSPLPRHPKGKG